MNNQKIEERIIELLNRNEPKEPQMITLGGGHYYRCGWLKCSEDINKFMNFCPRCGQRIDWSGK